MQQNDDSVIDRPAAVAGRFYPDNAVELTAEVRTLFSKAEKLITNPILDDEELLAIISPHAGYVFSGTVAASAYLLLKDRKDIQRVFLIGSSHHASFDAASVYFCGNFITPLGKVIVDRKTAKELINRSTVFQSIPEAHTPEHSLEVQLPFLQF
jgi:AmmeMemoRadiSam system protein B